MASKYQHSRVFNDMKAVKERIDENLTSAQYLKTIDFFLNRALCSIVSCSTYFDDYLVRLLGWQEAHPKRKVSFVSRQEFAAAVVNYLIQPTRALKLAKLDALRLERGVIIAACNGYVSSLNEYERVCNGTLYPDDVNRAISYRAKVEEALRATEPLMPSILLVRYFTDVAISYKHAVLEKYTRMCLNQAQKDYVSFFNMSVSLDDIVQAYILVAGRALDKCDYRQGVLTTHIQTWLYTARGTLAYEVSPGKSIEDLPIDLEESCDTLHDQIERESNILRVRKLARLVDPKGLGRLFLNIEEALPESETVNS